MIINRSRRRQKNTDWDAVGNIQELLNKPELFSGSYNDLSDLPTVPSIETGTWNPTTTLTSGGSVTFNPLYNKLKYVKIGSLVFITGYLVINSVSTPSGHFYINGLPYPCGSNYESGAGSGVYVSHLTNVDIRPFHAKIVPYGSNIVIGTYNKEGENDGAGYFAPIGSFLQASSNFMLSIFYNTNS